MTKLTAHELEELGIIAIVRADIPVDIRHVVNALTAGGIGAVEVTLNTPGALDAVRTIRAAGGIRVGAGTILSPDDAEAAIGAGAEYIVTPTLQPDTIAFCRKQGVPIAAGCLTPTEALAAHRAGADFIKLFPAEGLGPAYVRSLLAPLPFLKIIPTGGVTPETIGPFLKAGCVAVAAGSHLVSRDILVRQDWDRLAALAREFTDALARARS